MYSQNRSRFAALALVVCLAISPVSHAGFAAPRDGGDGGGIQQRIVQLIKKIQHIFGGVIAHEDYPSPPLP